MNYIHPKLVAVSLALLITIYKPHIKLKKKSQSVLIDKNAPDSITVIFYYLFRHVPQLMVIHYTLEELYVM